MWFGTQNGLNCWDGEIMKTFLPSDNDSTSIQDYNIQHIIQENNHLWVCTRAGVSRLNLKTMKFENFVVPSERIVLYRDSIFVISPVGLFTFNTHKNIFEKATSTYGGNNKLTAAFVDLEDNLWIADETAQRIIKISNTGKEYFQLPFSAPVELTELFVDSKKSLWIGTGAKGLVKYETESRKYTLINTISKPFYLNSPIVRQIIEDSENRIWVATFNGVSVFNIQNNSTSSIFSEKNNENSLRHNSVHSMYIGNDDIIWAGTYFGGVSYGKISDPLYKKYKKPLSAQTPLFPVIGQIIEDEKENLWIATEGGGLDYYNRETQIFTNYTKRNDNTGLSQTNVKTICLAKDKLLIGTFRGGLNILDLKTKKFEYKKFGSSQVTFESVTSIIPLGEDFLIGTNFGLFKYNLNGNFSKLLDSKIFENQSNPLFVNHLARDSKGLIWLGTEFHGLVSYNPINGEIMHYNNKSLHDNSPENQAINYVLEDHHFRLWVGTNGGGLYLFNKATQSFTQYTKDKDGIASNDIYGIQESRFGNLWVSTRNGLTRFDVENKKFYNYDHKSGFPLGELNHKALFLDKNGELFVGGIEGLVSFNEERLIHDNSNLNIIFSSLEVNNEEISANDNTQLLQAHISNTQKLTLKPNHTVFKIGFSACNFNQDNHNQYQYKLKGFDEKWVNAGFSSTATYTNLNPGKYTFSVRGTDAVGTPITPTESIEIIVKPPITRTWFAYLFYTLLIIGLILLFNYFYLGKVRLKYQLENARSEKDKIKEINQYKLMFFTNVSHEFMTPLTIILSSIENIFSKNKLPEEIKPSLQQILRNSKRLKNLNRELLDFRKLEQGHMRLQVQSNNIIPYLNDIFESFQVLAKEKKVNYQFVKNIEKEMLWYDSRQMDKVFYNLLSNAFNHTNVVGGMVTIKMESDQFETKIHISDNGKGISKDEVSKVFNRFFRADQIKKHNEYYGSGIGLALSENIVKAHKGTILCQSELGVGTTFTVSLKKGRSHFNNNEIATKITENQFSLDKDLIYTTGRLSNNLKEEVSELDSEEAPTLLIVDDNAEIRSIIKTIFIQKYHIELANSGEQGLEKAIQLQPDIIISDVKMPGMSGFEMCEMLKRNVKTSHIPIALLTALGSEEDKISGFKCGADSYITKPFNSESLVARIENLFENRKKLQSVFNQDLNTNSKSLAQNKTDQIFIDKAQQIIETHLLNPEFSVTDFAAEMSMSRTIFFKKIKAITGQTPNDFILTYKLKKAADILLKNTEKNVSEVAYDLGFNSPRYFSQCFKSHFGTSPSKYGK